MQPEVVVYVILAVPAVKPVTNPVPLPMDIAVPASLHLPPVVASLNMVVLPTQRPLAPVMAVIGFTVMVLFTAQLPME